MASSPASLLFVVTADSYLGLLSSDTQELSAPGYQRQRIAPDAWTDDGGALTGPDVLFTSITRDSPIVGFFLSDTAHGDILLAFRFASNQARRLITREDELIITPILDVEIV